MFQSLIVTHYSVRATVCSNASPSADRSQLASLQLDAAGQVVALEEATKKQILDSFSREGLRVLALAHKLTAAQVRAALPPAASAAHNW